MSLDSLEKDAQGNIVTRPVMGWVTAPVAGMFVLLGLKYAETPEQLKSGGKTLQFGLLPAQALELAEMLTTQARSILDAPRPSDPPNCSAGDFSVTHVYISVAMTTVIDHREGSRRLRHPEKAASPNSAILRKPDWIRVKAPVSREYAETRAIVREHGLHTVCEEAACPNIGECWTQRHATMMIMGDTCTRACAFCNVKTGLPGALDADEPDNVGRAVAKLGLKHVVITSVDRDDLADGGAGAFRAQRSAPSARHSPGTTDRSADAGFPAQGRRHRDRDGGAAGCVQPQSRNRAAALSERPARRALFRLAAPAGARQGHCRRRLHQIGPDGRPGRKPRRNHAGDGRSARGGRRFPHHRPISAADAQACGARPLLDAGRIQGAGGRSRAPRAS